MRTILSTLANSKCPKCGLGKKSGTFSCCARGGAWFKKCGDVGDTQFDHTWAEGIQACKDFGIRASIKEVMVRRVGVITYPLKTDRLNNDSHRQKNIYRNGSASTIGATNFVAHAKTTIYICASIVFLCFQM